MIYTEARELQRGWVFAHRRWEGYKTNIAHGLGDVQQQDERPRLDLPEPTVTASSIR